jgi:DNA-binding NtrC family response regulator
MPLELQATLLRVLENKRVMRLGGKSYRQVDFRITAATNRDLLEMVHEKTFREDLFYRLSVLTVRLPSLEERFEDKAFFARYYLNECRCKDPGGPQDFAPDTLERIVAFRWRGNVRQLRNAVFSSYFAARGRLIQISDLPAYIRGARQNEEGEGSADALSELSLPALPPQQGHTPQLLSALPPQQPVLREQERVAIDRALAQTGNNIAKAAELLGISRATLYRRLK